MKPPAAASDRLARPPWYREGLRFECQPDCGRCCTNHGEYEYVYLEGDDLPRLAAHLGLTEESFRGRFAIEEDGNVALRMDQPACPFLRGSRCEVYEARPKQCRTFPFWPENLRSRAQWETLATFCPGIGRGRLIPAEEVRLGIAGAETA